MSGMNLTLEQIAAWLPEGRSVGEGSVRIQRVHSDTRSLQAGDLLVALKGEHFDAADYLNDAATKGAAAVVGNLNARERLLAAGLPGVLVGDSRFALSQLARHWRRRFTGPLIAVTGSNGKTTVTQMLAAIMRAWQGEAAWATQGNFNNDIGVPLTLLGLRDEHRVAVVELGMNHPGEIAFLAGVAAPTVALVNNAQREHLEFMESVQAVARENGSVFMALPADGVAVFPAGDEHSDLWRTLAGARRCVTFGATDDGAAVFAHEATWKGDHWALQLQTPAGALDVSLHVPGRHNVSNALAAVACAHAAGVSLAAVAEGLAAFQPMAGRSRSLVLHRGGRAITLIDDSYNANPDSVRALIDWLAELPAPRLLVLGDMGEVGDQGAAFHAEVGAWARERGIDHLLAHGSLAIHAAMAFGGGRHFETMDELRAALRTHLSRVASIGVKGSRFMHMERVVEALQKTPDTGHATTRGPHAA